MTTLLLMTVKKLKAIMLTVATALERLRNQTFALQTGKIVFWDPDTKKFQGTGKMYSL